MNPPELVAVAEDARALGELNAWLTRKSAEERVVWALDNMPGEQVLSSSFGAQAAAMLHLVTRQRGDIPVVLIDTGYLFPETYRFADTLVERLALNLKVYRPAIGIAWMEARHGRLWEQGLDGIERYNRLRKVEPMQRALDELGARTWFAGLRRAQSQSRARTDIVELRNGRWKVHPIADWSDRDIGRYLKRHDLPYHPLWDAGYVSIGDMHTTRPLVDAGDTGATRFFGLKRECGLHVEV
ncbi:MAG: phosphoadenylyl-sulfate reductase [Proteobacteria bacterium]|nr:phosphoadenylyl-sulfate reductase [Pseudomonadota bacterium]